MPAINAKGRFWCGGDHVCIIYIYTHVYQYVAHFVCFQPLTDVCVGGEPGVPHFFYTLHGTWLQGLLPKPFTTVHRNTYIFLCTYVHTYIYTHIYIDTHTHIYIDTHTHIYIYTYIHKYTHTFTHILRKYTYVHICTYAYIYIYTYTYIYIHIL